MEKASTFAGLDVHKESIDVTIAESGAAGEVPHFGTIGGDRRWLSDLKLDHPAQRFALEEYLAVVDEATAIARELIGCLWAIARAHAARR